MRTGERRTTRRIEPRARHCAGTRTSAESQNEGRARRSAFEAWREWHGKHGVGGSSTTGSGESVTRVRGRPSHVTRAPDVKRRGAKPPRLAIASLVGPSTACGSARLGGHLRGRTSLRFSWPKRDGRRRSRASELALEILPGDIPPSDSLFKLPESFVGTENRVAVRRSPPSPCLSGAALDRRALEGVALDSLSSCLGPRLRARRRRRWVQRLARWGPGVPRDDRASRQRREHLCARLDPADDRQDRPPVHAPGPGRGDHQGGMDNRRGMRPRDGGPRGRGRRKRHSVVQPGDGSGSAPRSSPGARPAIRSRPPTGASPDSPSRPSFARSA